MTFHADKNQNVHFEILDIHYYSMSYMKCCDTTDSVC